MTTCEKEHVYFVICLYVYVDLAILKKCIVVLMVNTLQLKYLESLKLFLCLHKINYYTSGYSPLIPFLQQ